MCNIFKTNILGHPPSSTGSEGVDSGVSPVPVDQRPAPMPTPPGVGNRPQVGGADLPAPGSYPHPSSGWLLFCFISTCVFWVCALVCRSVLPLNGESLAE